jgi:hypothetical protein
MVADGSWNNTNEKDSKIAALASMVNDMKTKYGMLTKKVSFKGESSHHLHLQIFPRPQAWLLFH